MKKQIFLLFLVFAWGREDFIDELEYGRKLYENPRGISCQKCHGIKGEGTLIATYKSRGKDKKLIAPQINNLSLKNFIEKVNASEGLMPKYYLTDKEIQAIFNFLQSQ